MCTSPLLTSQQYSTDLATQSSWQQDCFDVSYFYHVHGKLRFICYSIYLVAFSIHRSRLDAARCSLIYSPLSKLFFGPGPETCVFRIYRQRYTQGVRVCMEMWGETKRTIGFLFRDTFIANCIATLFSLCVFLHFLFTPLLLVRSSGLITTRDLSLSTVG